MKPKVAIILSEFHPQIGDSLLGGAEEVLKKAGVSFDVFKVPGAFEIPLMAQRLALRKKFQVMVALGCIIKGDTFHFELVAQQCAAGCMKVSLEQHIPIVFEVLACFSEKDAFKRSSGKNNAGKVAAEVALYWLKNSHV